MDTILEGHEHAREARVKLEQDNKEVGEYRRHSSDCTSSAVMYVHYIR